MDVVPTGSPDPGTSQGVTPASAFPSGEVSNGLSGPSYGGSVTSEVSLTASGHSPDVLPEQPQSGSATIASTTVDNGMDQFHRLRSRLLLATIAATAAAVPLCWLLFDVTAAISLLVGALAGILYMVLLARSVARLGGGRRSIGKIQLLVPVVLVLASTRLPQLELVPALVGFLLYKPALLVQAYLDR